MSSSSLCELCQLPSSLRCPACRTPYCSSTHQKQVWTLHKYLCGKDISVLYQPTLVREEIQHVVDKMELGMDPEEKEDGVAKKFLTDSEIDEFVEHQREAQMDRSPAQRSIATANLRHGLTEEDPAAQAAIKAHRYLLYYYKIAYQQHELDRVGLKPEIASSVHYLLLLLNCAMDDYQYKNPTNELQINGIEAIALQYKTISRKMIENHKDDPRYLLFPYYSLEVEALMEKRAYDILVRQGKMSKEAADLTVKVKREKLTQGHQAIHQAIQRFPKK